MSIFLFFQLSWEMLILLKIVKKVVTILRLNVFPIFIFQNSNVIGFFLRLNITLRI
jgi:hypothetical protein